MTRDDDGETRIDEMKAGMELWRPVITIPLGIFKLELSKRDRVLEEDLKAEMEQGDPDDR